MKQLFLLGILSGIGASAASLVYSYFYVNQVFAGMIDYTPVMTSTHIAGACIGGCMMAAMGYFVLSKFLGKWTDISHNLLFSLLSIASIIGPISATLPETIDVEIGQIAFFGYAVPMHFFPALAWMTLRPLFNFKEEAKAA